MQFTHTHTQRETKQTELHCKQRVTQRVESERARRERMVPTALLAVTVAMPKAKANCIFEAYINIFAALLCSALAARAPDALAQIKRERERAPWQESKSVTDRQCERV